MRARSRNAIGPRIRELRRAHALSLNELATRVNISASHLSRLERGQTSPSFTVAAALAREFGVSADELWDIHQKQLGVDARLIDTLHALGVSMATATHICDAISTTARLELLDALQSPAE